MCTSKDLKQNYKRILQDIELYQHKNSMHLVKLLAVSKTQPVELIKKLYNLGQFDYGENYLTEALDKITQCNDIKNPKPSNKKIIWHYIGSIQSNKTKLIAENFDWVHSVDKFKTAQRLAAQRPGHQNKLNILIQVNLQNDTSKGGIQPYSVENLTKEIIKLEAQNTNKINLRGLMCILKQDTKSYAEQYRLYSTLIELLENLNNQFNLSMDTISMGMSGDYKAAIQSFYDKYEASEQSKNLYIRIGSSLFGPRDKS